jgi:hypothetical protein
MIVVTATLSDLLFVAHRMRDDEIEQYLAITGNEAYDPDDCVRSVLQVMGEVNFCMLDADGNPYCIGGYDEIRPKVWQTWMMGTPDGWKNHWRDITKLSRRTMDALLSSSRAHRVQCYALASRTEAHDWYRRGLGMTFEATVQKLFADGQDGVCYVKVKE